MYFVKSAVFNNSEELRHGFTYMLKNNAVEVNHIKARRLFDQNDVCKQAPSPHRQSTNLCKTGNLFEVCTDVSQIEYPF